MGGAQVSSLRYDRGEDPAINKNRDTATRSLPQIQEEVMEIEQILNDYRNGDDDKRLCLFLTYRELRDEFNRVDQENAAHQSPILCYPTSVHRDMIKRILTIFSKGFRHPKSCCSFSVGAGRMR